MVASSASPVAVILAGGTGGHVYPALAVATEMCARGYAIHWLGTERGLEARVVPEAGYPLHTLTVSGIRGKSLRQRMAALWALVGAVLQALRILRRLKPAVVLGMGGYAAGPGGIAAWLLRRPLVIHEQNSVAGTTNSILSRFASAIVTAFPSAFAGEREVRLLGNPVRAQLLERREDTLVSYDGQRPLRLLVLGGSLGARAINEVLPDALRQLPVDCSLQVRHQTGEAHCDVVKASYSSLDHVEVAVQAYIEDMASAYHWADLVLCRAGALTVAELTIMGCPSVLVPLPHAIDNHQFHNAQWLASRGAAVLLPQSEMTGAAVAELLAQFRAAPARLNAMAAAANAAATPGATQAVASVCEELARGQ